MARDEEGETPLHLVVGYPDNLDEFEALLAAGADLEAQDEGGNTPLHAAAAYRVSWDEERHAGAVIEAMLDAGADGTARNATGETPWDLAEENEALKGSDAFWQLVAGVVHDYLYQHPQEVGSRWRKDVICYKIARAGKWRTSLLPACLGFLGLVLFGWLFRKDGHGGHLRNRRFGSRSDNSWAIYKMVSCFYPAPSGSMIEVVVCMLLASANLRALVSWRRSRQRKALERLEAVGSR